MNLIIIGLIASIIINLILAKFMARAAALKGYGDESAPFWLVFLFGFVGCFYVIALPDLELRRQNEELISFNKQIHAHADEKPMEDKLPEI